MNIQYYILEYRVTKGNDIIINWQKWLYSKLYSGKDIQNTLQNYQKHYGQNRSGYLYEFRLREAYLHEGDDFIGYAVTQVTFYTDRTYPDTIIPTHIMSGSKVYREDSIDNTIRNLTIDRNRCNQDKWTHRFGHVRVYVNKIDLNI